MTYGSLIIDREASVRPSVCPSVCALTAEPFDLPTKTLKVIQVGRTEGRTKGNAISPFRNFVATGDKYASNLIAKYYI